MAILQISKIQQRSGNLVDLPQLDEAEFGWASDQRQLFIGKTTPNENVEVLTAYSTISFSQIAGAVGNLNITATSIANGEVLAFDGTNWVNRGGNAGGLITLGDAGNVKIDGGASGYVLQTDGSGNLSWTPKSVIVANVMNVTKANPAVVTTADNNFFPNGASVTFTDAQGMTQLNGNTYTATLISSNSFSIGVNSSAYDAYAFTNVTGTTISTDRVTVGNSAQFTANSAVKFTGNLSTSGITANKTYYVLGAPPTGTTIKIATSPDSNASNVVVLQTTTGLTANVYQTAGRAISNVSGGSGFGVANGTNTTVQYNNGGLLAGDSSFTYDFVSSPRLLTLNGNANVGNLISSGIVTGTKLVSNIATGTAPIQVTSTTRVANLSVAYANVSDYGAVTTQTTGTFYPVLVSANTSANYALASNANISFNVATGLLTTPALSVTGNANVGNLGTAGLIVATGNVTGGNLVTGGVLSVTGNANVGNLGTVGNITAANVTANHFGNGAALSSLTGANVSGQVGYAAVANSVAVANVSGIGNIAVINLDGNDSNVLYGNGVFAAAGSGPLGSYGNSNVAAFLAAFGSNTLSTTGNANVGNLGAAGLFTATGNITGSNIITAGRVVATGNVTGSNIVAAGDIIATGNANVTANVNLTGNLNASGNANISRNLRIDGNATSNNIAIGYYANIGADLGVSGNSNVTGNAIVGGNIAIAGSGTIAALTTSGNANIGANLNVTGNSRVTGNSTVVANLNVSGNTTIGGNTTITGTLTLNSSLTVPANLTAGNVIINSQANIGTTLLVVGNITTYSNANIGANLIVLGNSSVAGNSVITGNVTALNGTFGGGATIAGTLKVSGAANVSGNLNIASNASVTQSVAVTRNITAGGNITSSSGIFTGNGSGLTNLPGANVLGTVANATYATNAGTASTATNATYATNAGIASYATTAQSVSTISSSQVTTALGYTPVAPGDFTGSLSGNGWTRLPNGLIMQWGVTPAISQNSGSVYVPVPTSFVNGAFSITGSPINATNGRGGAYDQIAQIVNFGTTSGFYIMLQGTSSDNTFLPISWIAMGQ